MEKEIDIFLSYARKDKGLRDKLVEHLSLLKQQGYIATWYDGDIGAGTEWQQAIHEYLNKARLILLLISPAFMASEYCYCNEMIRALERHDAGEARVIPILLRPVDWHNAPFGRLQALPPNAQPLTLSRNRDKTLFDIAQGIRKAVEELAASSITNMQTASKEAPLSQKALAPTTPLPEMQKAGIITTYPLTFNKEKEEIAIVRNQYCEALSKRWSMLDFKGIMHVDMNKPISIPLTDVFVLPDVLLGIPEHETLERESEHFLYGKHSQRKVKRVIPQREALHMALAKYRRLVILGDPGSGKSTLLRYLLLQLVQGSATFTIVFPQLTDIATSVPVYMPLATYAEVLLSNAPGTRSLEDFLPIYLHDNYLGTFTNFIQAQLQQGNLFFLFDGLDEIPDTSLRMSVVRHIEMFTQTYAANRFMITSRIVGYKATPLSTEYQPYTLADFNEEQVRTFTQRWCPAYEYWVQHAREGQHLEDAATKEAETLFSATQSRPGVKRLAVNPLLLTILALIQRQGIELPSHRVELFELCAITLIDTWVKARGRSTHISKNDIIKILRPLAFWMHEHAAVGAVPEDELYEQIVRQLIGRKINEYEATKIAEQFLETVRGETGILVERGKARYGFLHLTFEEYFAARELEKRKDRNSFIRAHLHDPRWREVILLTVGTIGILQSNEEEVTELIQETIASARSLYEQTLHRDLLLAGLCLADDVGVNTACESELLEQIVYLYITTPHDRLRNTCSNVLAEWSGSRIAEKANTLVFPLLQERATPSDPDQTQVARSPFEKALTQDIEQSAIQYQETMTKHLQFHVTVLLAMLQTVNDVDWRGNLIGILSEDALKERMVSVFEQQPDIQLCITEALLVAFSDPDAYVRWNAIAALGQFGIIPSHVMDVLLAAVSDTRYLVREAALNILGQCSDAQVGVLNPLLEALLDGLGEREAVVRALGQFSNGDPPVINALLTSLSDIDSWAVRQAAATALARVGKGQLHVVDALLIALSDTDEEVREAAANSLGQLYEGKNDDVIDALLTATADPNANIVELTANALGQLSSNPSYVTEVLRRSFSNVSRARETAANALGLFSAKQARVVDALLARLAESSSLAIKRDSVRALRHLGESQVHIIDALLMTLAESSSWRLRKEIVSTLGQLRSHEPRAIDALLDATRDSSWRVRREAIRAFTKLRKRDSRILEALQAALSDDWTRWDALIALGELNNGESWINREFLIALTDHVVNNQQEAMQALGRLVKTQPEMMRSWLRDLPSNELTSRTTQVYRERLRAAFVERALEMVGVIGTAQPTIIDAAFSLLADSNVSIRSEAGSSLGRLSKKNRSIINRLLPLLCNPEMDVREAVLQAFRQFGEGLPQVIDALLLALSEGESRVRRAAVMALGQCGKGQTRAIDALLQRMTDEDSLVRAWAARVLGMLGDKQPRIIEALLQALSDPISGIVRNAAASALQSLNDGQEQVVEALLQTLFGPSLLARLSVAQAFGRLWDGQMSMIDTLLTHVSTSDVLEKVSAVRAFSDMKDKGPQIIDALLPNLSDPSWLVREATAEALKDPDLHQPNAVASLLSILSDPSSRVRAAAAEALQITEGGSEEIVEALLRATYDSDWAVREAAALGLSTSQIYTKIIGERLESLLQQYERILQRDMRGTSRIIDALYEIAKKV